MELSLKSLPIQSEQLASSIFVTGIWPEPETFLLFIAVGFLRSFFVLDL